MILCENENNSIRSTNDKCPCILRRVHSCVSSFLFFSHDIEYRRKEIENSSTLPKNSVSSVLRHLNYFSKDLFPCHRHPHLSKRGNLHPLTKHSCHFRYLSSFIQPTSLSVLQLRFFVPFCLDSVFFFRLCINNSSRILYRKNLYGNSHALSSCCVFVTTVKDRKHTSPFTFEGLHKCTSPCPWTLTVSHFNNHPPNDFFKTTRSFIITGQSSKRDISFLPFSTHQCCSDDVVALISTKTSL